MTAPPTREALTAAPSRVAAAEMLSGLTVAQLRDAADSYRVTVGSRDTKAEIVQRIVRATVGARLTSEAFRGALR